MHWFYGSFSFFPLFQTDVYLSFSTFDLIRRVAKIVRFSFVWQIQWRTQKRLFIIGWWSVWTRVTVNARIEEIQDRAENRSWVSTIRWRVIPWCPVRWLRVGPQVKPAPCQMGNPVSHVHNRVAITQSWLPLKCRSYNCSFLCFFSLDHNIMANP